jgi:hypothetical protein
MRSRTVVAVVSLIVVGTMAVGCATSPPIDFTRQIGTSTNPYVGTSSPFYAKSWSGQVNDPGNIRNTLYFRACAQTPGVVAVAVQNPADGGYMPGAVYTVTVTEPGGTTTEPHQVSDVMTTPYSLAVGDCFSVTLTSVVEKIGFLGCEGDGCEGPFVYYWPGADTMIYW